MKYKLVYFLISLFFLFPSAFYLINHGLKPAVDFTGGTLLEVSIKPTHDETVTVEKVKEIASQTVNLHSLQTTGDNTFLIRAQEFDQLKNSELQQQFSDQLGEPEEISFSTLGPTLGKELIRKTLIGVSLAAGFILLYVTIRFKDKKYGICAILAMLHDTFILLGVYLGFPIFLAPLPLSQSCLLLLALS